MELTKIKAVENKNLIKKILKKIKDIHNKAKNITSLYMDENENIFANVDCGCYPRYFFHLWIDASGNIVFINKYLWGQFTPTSNNFGRIDCEFRFPICGKTNAGSYLYNIKTGKDIISLTSLGEFRENENSDELEAEAIITIKGNYYIAFKINSSGKITSLIASNINDILIDPNEEGFNLNKCIEDLNQEAIKLLNIERETCSKPVLYTHKPSILEGEL